MANWVKIHGQIAEWKLPHAHEAMTVFLHRHIYHPGKWVLMCRALSIGEVVMKATEIEDAKLEAERAISDRLAFYEREFGAMLNEVLEGVKDTSSDTYPKKKKHR